MWTVEWFENTYTHGCYRESDWWEDLIDYFGEDHVLTIRAMMDRLAPYEEWVAFTEGLKKSVDNSQTDTKG